MFQFDVCVFVVFFLWIHRIDVVVEFLGEMEIERDGSGIDANQ